MGMSSDVTMLKFMQSWSDLVTVPMVMEAVELKVIYNKEMLLFLLLRRYDAGVHWGILYTNTFQNVKFLKCSLLVEC